MPKPSRMKLPRTSYHVAWICPLDLELLPAVLMLDEEHEPPDIDTYSDENAYQFGSAAGHNIVLATCRQAETGNVNVSSITAPLIKTFPNVRMTLLVGIGGGVPQPKSFCDPLNDLRLGDVVVGWPTSADGRPAVVYYESGRSRVDGFEMTGTMDKPHTVLLNALPSMKLDYDLGRSTFDQHMAKLQNHERLGNRFRHPGLEHDKLYQPGYAHLGGYDSYCNECNSGQLVERAPRDDTQKDLFVYHQGRIATGNSVIMDGEKRDLISRQCGGALCIEMEAAGVEVSSRCLVIRGISDYADSHKNDLWRPYAAGRAVVFARELLGKIPARDVKEKMASGQLALYYPETIVPTVGSMDQRDEQAFQPLLDGPQSVKPSRARDMRYHVPGNKHWLVSRSTNPNFTGRRPDLDRIVKRLTSDNPGTDQRRFVLTGMGGQGKSEICLHVANEIRDSFWGVFWVDVSTQTSAEENFSEVAEALGCSKTVDAVRRTLSNLPEANQWLLILDNADDPHSDYQKYLPSGNRGSILITSRNPQCGQLAKTGGHEVLDSLEQPDCIRLLQRTAQLPEIVPGTRDHGFAVSLAEQLGYHTLALLHAGSYIATTNCSIAEYLEFFQTNRKRLLERPRGQGQSRYDTVYATFGASVEYLESHETGTSEETCQDSLQLLRVLSSFNYQSIPLGIILDAREGARKALIVPKTWAMYTEVLTDWHVAQLPEFMRSEKDDMKLRIIEAVTLLESLALVRTDHSTHFWKPVSMHPLVHGWAGDCQSHEEKQEALRMCQCIVALSHYGSNDWRPYLHQFGLHLKRVVESDAELPESASRSIHILQVCVQIAWVYHRARLHKSMYEFTSRIFEGLGLADQGPTAELRELYRSFAVAVDREGSRPTQALSLFKMIARFDDKTRPESDKARLQNKRDLGRSHLNNEEIHVAIELLETVVRGYQALGEEHRDLLTAEHDLAIALSRLGRNKQAITLLEKVVEIRQRLFPADNPDRLASQQTLAVAHLKDGQVAAATTELEQVARWEAEAFGEDHPETTATRTYLADAYKRAGRLSEAIPLYERVFNTRLLMLGEERCNRDVLKIQRQLSRAYFDAGRLEEATRTFERVGIVDQSDFNDVDHARLVPQFHIAKICLGSGRVMEAVGILEEVVGFRQSLLGGEDPELLAAQHLLSDGYLKSGRAREAIDILEMVVEIRKSTLEAMDFELLASRHLLAEAYLEHGMVSQAIDTIEEVVGLQQSILDITDTRLLSSQRVLSEAYLESGRASEAVAVLEHVVEMHKLLYSEGNPERVLLQESLAQAYRIQQTLEGS